LRSYGILRASWALAKQGAKPQVVPGEYGPEVRKPVGVDIVLDDVEGGIKQSREIYRDAKSVYEGSSTVRKAITRYL
jgi:hypothetical protein